MQTFYGALSLAMFVVLGGCSSMDNLYHKEGDHFKNWRVKSNPHAFSPSLVEHYREVCPALPTNPNKPDLENCIPETTADGREHYEFAAEGGYAGGFGQSAIQAAGFVGGMYVLGSSLRPAQTNVTQNGGGASQTQGQHQGQLQHQGIVNGGGKH